jgi:cell division GTPase FtsZ
MSATTNEPTVAIVGIGESVLAPLERVLRGDVSNSEKIIVAAVGLPKKTGFTLLQHGRAGAEVSGEAESLCEFLKGTDLILLTGCMGDVGEDMLCSVGDAAKEAGALVAAIVAVPFHFDGKMRGTDRLKRVVDAVIPIDETTLNFSRVDSENAPFSARDNAFFLIIEAFIDIVLTPGMVNVDLLDLKEALDDAGSVSVEYSIPREPGVSKMRARSVQK